MMRNIILLVAIGLFVHPVFANSSISENNPNKNCVPYFEEGKPAGYQCLDSSEKVPGDNNEKLNMKNGDTMNGSQGRSP